MQPHLASVCHDSHGEWEPRTLAEALRSPEREHWEKANLSEHQSLDENNVFTVVPRPSDKHVIGTTVVFKKKFDQHCNPPRYKVRVGARRDRQLPGIEYSDTHAPVVDKTSVTMFLTILASIGLQMSQFDVKPLCIWHIIITIDCVSNCHLRAKKEEIKNILWDAVREVYFKKLDSHFDKWSRACPDFYYA